MRFGVCTTLERAARLRQAGYDYVEPTVAGTLQPEQPEQDIMPPLRQAAQDAPIKPETYNVFLPGDLKVVGEAVDPERQARYLQSACARAAALGGQVIVFGSAGSRRIPEGFSRAQAEQQTIAFLKRCAEAASPHHLTIAIEPLNSEECNFINSVAEAQTLAAAVDHPAIGVLSDLYHVTQDGQSYGETRAAGPLLKHVHIAGAVGRRAPVEDDLDFLIPYFRVLKEMGYDRRISIEGEWDDLENQAETSLGVARRAWELA